MSDAPSPVMSPEQHARLMVRLMMSSPRPASTLNGGSMSTGKTCRADASHPG